MKYYNRSIPILDLSGNCFSRFGLEPLCEELGKTSLEELYLGNSCQQLMTPDDLHYCLNLLEKSSLRILDLSGFKFCKQEDSNLYARLLCMNLEELYLDDCFPNED